jgi:glycosyltransferase 2 family protein
VIVRLSAGSVARLAVAVTLTAVIIWRNNPGAILASATRTDLRWIFAAVLLVLLDRSLMAYRWVVLLRVADAGERVPLAAILRVFFVSTFVGTFLPASIGADAVRAYSLSRTHVGAAPALASVLMDRLLGVVSLLIVSVAGLAVAADLFEETVLLVAIGVVAAACLAGLALVYSEAWASWISGRLARMPGANVRRLGAELVTAVRAYSTRHSAIGNVLAGSIAVQALRILQAFALGRSIGIEAPLSAYVAFVPIILLIMLLPISIYGLGTSQLAFAAFFSRVGVPSGDAIALSLLFLALGILGNLPGAILYVAGSRRVPQEARRS